MFKVIRQVKKSIKKFTFEKLVFFCRKMAYEKY